MLHYIYVIYFTVLISESCLRCLWEEEEVGFGVPWAETTMAVSLQVFDTLTFVITILEIKQVEPRLRLYLQLMVDYDYRSGASFLYSILFCINLRFIWLYALMHAEHLVAKFGFLIPSSWFILLRLQLHRAAALWCRFQYLCLMMNDMVHSCFAYCCCDEFRLYFNCLFFF